MGRFLRHALALAVLLAVLLPFLWMAYAAFMPKEAVYSGELFSRVGFSLENVRALAREGFWGRLLFSLGVSSGAVALELFTALFAAYALRAGLGLLPFYLVLMAIPAELLLVPLYGVLKDLSLLETFWALLLPFAASPFVIYLVYQGMRAVPEELLEAAKLDGAGHRVLLFRILLPWCAPPWWRPGFWPSPPTGTWSSTPGWWSPTRGFGRSRPGSRTCSASTPRTGASSRRRPSSASSPSPSSTSSLSGGWWPPLRKG